MLLLWNNDKSKGDEKHFCMRLLNERADPGKLLFLLSAYHYNQQSEVWRVRMQETYCGCNWVLSLAVDYSFPGVTLACFSDQNLTFSTLLVQSPLHLVICSHHNCNLPLLLNKLQMLWHIHANKYLQLYAFTSITNCTCLLKGTYRFENAKNYPGNVSKQLKNKM